MDERDGEAAEQLESATSIHDQVLEWIKREGYPLEMLVAAAFHEAGAVYVEQSKYYRDQISGEIREIDVVAIYSGILPGEGGKVWLTAYVVTECKSGSSPWVVFRQSEGAAEYDQDIALRMLATVGIGEERFGRIMTRASSADPKLLTTRWRPGYAISEKRNTSKGGVNKAFDAVRQAAAAAWGILFELKDSNASIPPAAAIPVVVTSSPIFNCQLNGDGDLHLEPVERSAVIVRASSGSSPVVVHVVNVDALDGLVDDCRVTINGLCVSSIGPG